MGRSELIVQVNTLSSKELNHSGNILFSTRIRSFVCNFFSWLFPFFVFNNENDEGASYITPTEAESTTRNNYNTWFPSRRDNHHLWDHQVTHSWTLQSLNRFEIQSRLLLLLWRNATMAASKAMLNQRVERLWCSERTLRIMKLAKHVPRRCSIIIKVKMIALEPRSITEKRIFVIAMHYWLFRPTRTCDGRHRTDTSWRQTKTLDDKAARNAVDKGLLWKKFGMNPESLDSPETPATRRKWWTDAKRRTWHCVPLVFYV